MPGRDYRQELTDKLVAALEAGTAPWQRPWDPGMSLPHNPTTGKAYRGANVLALQMQAMASGYTDPRWCTYRQAQERGWQVRKGEHGSVVTYWKRTEEVVQKDPDTGEERKTEVAVEKPHPFSAVVFNGSQIDGIPALEPRQSAWAPALRAESILAASGARIVHGGARACYVPSSDTIHLPPRDTFHTAAGYYDTALHELTHWTGHESRLNRLDGAAFGTPSYAREELRAEIGSMFLSAETGIAHDTSQHAAYVGEWIKVLRQDKHEIFRAAGDANRAADYLLAKEQEQERQEPARAADSAEALLAQAAQQFRAEGHAAGEALAAEAAAAEADAAYRSLVLSYQSGVDLPTAAVEVAHARHLDGGTAAHMACLVYFHLERQGAPQVSPDAWEAAQAQAADQDRELFEVDPADFGLAGLGRDADMDR
jgi:antirestriction protein ArdC